MWGGAQFASPCQGDEDAIIKKTRQIYEAWEGMEVMFTAQEYNIQNGASENYEGTISMKKDKFVLTTPQMTVWFDGVTQWSLQRNDEVHIDKPASDDILLNPMLLFRDYNKNYKATLTGESTSHNAKKAYDLTFTPQRKTNIEKIELQIERNTSLPAKLVITLRNAIRITITINGWKATSLSDEFFVFPKASYPNVEIIDLR